MKHARVATKDRRGRLEALTEQIAPEPLDSPEAQRSRGKSSTPLIDENDVDEPRRWFGHWDRRSQKAAIALLGGLLLVVVWWWWSGRPAEQIVVNNESAAVTSNEESLAVQPSAVVVHVVGDVAEPGVVELPAGARVLDAIEAVGGATKKRATESVNLARTLVDGEQIIVGVAAEGTDDGTVSLNNADAATLEQLPGVGPVIAERIVQWRTDNGPFRSVEELAEISGIGTAMVDRIKDQVRM